MTEAILKEDIRSKCKGSQLYGSKGEKVKIIRIYGHVALVKGKDTFPVNINKLKMINENKTTTRNEQDQQAHI